MRHVTIFLIALAPACNREAEHLARPEAPQPPTQEHTPRSPRPACTTALPPEDVAHEPRVGRESESESESGSESESEFESEPAAESESESESEVAALTCDESPNRVRDGSFEIEPFETCGWQTYDVQDWGVLAVRECELADHPGCAAFLASDVWGDDWVALFYQDMVLEPRRTYRFSFEAKADREPRGLVFALLGAGPEGGIGNETAISLWPDWWTTFETTFLAAEEAAIYSQLVFAIGGAESYLYLDNVAIVPVDR